jgi:hypothetical protein
MAQTFEERVEEVLGELHGMAWPLLDEPQKRKIVGKIVRGIDRYGDSQADWTRALGVAKATLSDRIAHFRRSEPMDGVRRVAENERKRLNHAKAVLRDPELVEKLLDDRSTARAIAKAAAEHQETVERQERAAQRGRAPELVDRAGFNAVAGDLLRLRVKYARVLDDARELKLKRDEAQALRDDVESIAAITDWFVSFLDSGASDFDTELEKMLEG